MNNDKKISDGLNDRSRDETIAQSGGGIPDDSSQPLEIDDAEVERVRRKLVGDERQQLTEDER